MEINFSLKSLTKIRKVRRINNPLVSLVHWGWKYICRKYKISARSTLDDRKQRWRSKWTTPNCVGMRDEFSLSVRPSVRLSICLKRGGRGMITVLSPPDENILVDVTILTIKRREGSPATSRFQNAGWGGTLSRRSSIVVSSFERWKGGRERNRIRR